MHFTNDQLKQLKEAESHFNTMVNADYKRNTPRSLDEKIHKIYTEATGTEYKMNWNCSVCIGKLYKTVGRLYFEDLTEVSVGTEPSASEIPESHISSKVVANKKNTKPKTK